MSADGGGQDGGLRDGGLGDAGFRPLPYPGSIALPATPQRSGDPLRGYDALVNNGYISIGIPWSGFEFAMTTLQPRDALPGRRGNNARVGYSWNVSTNQFGVELASFNCLSCHAAHLNGKLIVGLGRPQHEPVIPSGVATNPSLITLGLRTVQEAAHYQLFGRRLLVTQEAGELMAFGAQAAHRDPHTLAWSTDTRFDASTPLEGWVDIPPWWRTKKKNALYANGMGRGDQVRHMMNMIVFSVEDVAEADRIDSYFTDVAAFLRSITPPKYPGTIDAALAASGKRVFELTCASCHGTYGPDEHYPNLFIPVELVGTDPELAKHSWANPAAVSWFNQSYFSKRGARLDPQPGYVAPPLDGIWATAPFFHNGSVPTLEGVIDSLKRPTRWTRSFGDSDYDLAAVGWKAGGTGPEYDTTRLGFSNRGHTFADGLSFSDRRALLEYLKSL